MWHNGIYILDYPDRITAEKITEEGRKRIKEAIKIMEEFNKELNVKTDLNHE